LLSGCSTNSKLRSEISEIETRVVSAESDITARTAEIGAPGPDLQARLSYRPLQAWAGSFSSRPDTERTITFVQTDRDGDLLSVGHRCRPFPPWDAFYRNGKRVRIHEADSTRFGLTLGQFAVEQQTDGLTLRTRLALDGRTQIYGWHRIPCAPGGIDANIGVPFSARTTAVVQLKVAPNNEGAAIYRLALVEPNSIGIELSTEILGFTFRHTLPVNNVARELASGELDLMFDRVIELKMPNGDIRRYKLSNVDPKVATELNGVKFSSDFEFGPSEN